MIIKLNSTYYPLWKTLMDDMLYIKDLYDFIEGDTSRPKDKDDGEWKSEQKNSCIESRVFGFECIFSCRHKQKPGKSGRN